MTETKTDTKERILDAAEPLFADHGFAATSMRSITARAEVNLAAVNYHFGSKEALIDAVFTRRLHPLNEERLERLAQVEVESSDQAPSLEQIVESFVGPALRLGHDQPVFMRLLGHALSEPSVREMFTEQFREVFQRFSVALKRALPSLPPEELVWRFLFMVGAMAYSMAMACDINRMSHGLCKSDDVEATLRRLVPFLAAGMRSAVPAATAEGG